MIDQILMVSFGALCVVMAILIVVLFCTYQDEDA